MLREPAWRLAAGLVLITIPLFHGVNCQVNLLLGELTGVDQLDDLRVSRVDLD